VGNLRPDVILLDLAMPGLNGLEAIPLLHTALPLVKIVILTLLESGNDRQAAVSAGADEFVTKTEMLTELMPAISRVLETGQRFKSVSKKHKEERKSYQMRMREEKQTMQLICPGFHERGRKYGFSSEKTSYPNSMFMLLTPGLDLSLQITPDDLAHDTKRKPK
jgi:DNA-binding NarL/FixJ family response regulator